MSKGPNHQEQIDFFILKELREMRSDVVNNHLMLAEHSDSISQLIKVISELSKSLAYTNSRIDRIEKFIKNVLFDVLADGQNQVLTRQGKIVYIDKKKGIILKPEIDFKEAA